MDDVAEDRPELPYAVFTDRFDCELEGSEVALALANSGARLGLPSMIEVADVKQRLATAEQAYNDCRNSPEAGALDRKLREYGEDLAICVLIDQSGSMVNRSPAISGQLKCAAELCETAGVNLSLLGFTTMGWHGGLARQAWIAAGRPPYPGRICSLLHVVHKEFSSPISDSNWREMSDPGCHFENVDGEALIWARNRLLRQASPSKLLIVISDGAPVDDATFAANGSEFLVRHLRSVIAEFEADDAMELVAIGIDYAVDGYYTNAINSDSSVNILQLLTDAITIPQLPHPATI